MHISPDGTVEKVSACQCRSCKRCGFDPWVETIPWRRKWQPTPVILPGESHGWGILVGYSLQGCKEPNPTEQLSLSVFTSQEALVVKNPPEKAGDVKDMGLISGLRRSPGEGNGNPLQHFCLENLMVRENWQAIVHRVAQS